MKGYQKLTASGTPEEYYMRELTEELQKRLVDGSSYGMLG